MEGPRGIVFNIQRFSLYDGPGLRTTVFLKGCPLRCPWCHNPESQSPLPEIMYWKSRCLGCGACAALCPAGALRLVDGRVVPTGERCMSCGECVERCPAGARGVSGRSITSEEALSEILKDNVFYDQSGGGVTFSGGEPLAQPEFLESTMRLCKEAGLMTAVDTCGFAPWEVIERIIPFSDLFLYDVKHMDDAVHRKLVGVSNEFILENLRRLAATGKEVTARLPVIPGANDESVNIRKTGEFLSSVGVSRITVLPYHDMGREKYERLGRNYTMEGLPEPSGQVIERVTDVLRSFGLRVEVSGRP